MSKKSLTSYSVNRSVQELEKIILEKTGLKKATLHEKAIEYFYNEKNDQVHPRLLLHANEKGYVERDTREQVYVSEEMRRMIRELAELPYNQCDESTVFFHALMTYCNIQYQLLIKG